MHLKMSFGFLLAARLEIHFFGILKSTILFQILCYFHFWNLEFTNFEFKIAFWDYFLVFQTIVLIT